MRLVSIMLALAFLLTAPPAAAGAWLREQGTGFLAVSATLRHLPGGLRHETALYGEYGLRPRLTLGIDIDNRSDLVGHALGFLRLPLAATGNGTRLTLDLGAGAHFDNGAWAPMTRATLSLGRSLATGWGDAWIGLDAAYERRFGRPQGAIKLDAALGLSSGPRVRPLVQLESYLVPGGPLYWTATASVMIDTRRGRTWVVGLQRGNAASGRYGIKAALWQEF